jgi:hypothetical protein
MAPTIVGNRTHVTPNRIRRMTHPTADTSLLFRRGMDVAGPKRMAHALNASLGHTYRMGRDSGDVDAEGTGARNMFDHMEAAGELLASRGEDGRAVLVEWRQWTDALFSRLLGESVPARPVTMEDVGAAAKEFGEFAAAAGDPERVNKEGAEAIAKIVEIMQRSSARTAPAPARHGLEIA